MPYTLQHFSYFLYSRLLGLVSDFTNMKNYFKKNWPIFVLLVLAILTRFLFLGYPSEVVFDEVHFGKFVSSYFTHQYYFDIHPPLGKLMIAGFSKIFGFQAGADFSNIGESINKNELFILRFLPALFGVLFILLIYQLILLIGLSKKAAFLGAFLVLFDNTILTQSKFILVDIFLLFFGFLALYFFILSKKYNNFSKKSFLFLVFASISSAFAFSIKWTGLSFWAIILFFTFLDIFKLSTKEQRKQIILKFAILIVLPFLVYLSIFAIHFKILSKSGPGDAFMSPGFQKTLLGNKIEENIAPFSFWQKFIDLNKSTYKYNAGLKSGHPDSSKWYQWPFGKKPIWYWTNSANSGQADGKVANIYLLGNPLVWWSILLTVLVAIFILFKKRLRKKMPLIIYLLIFGYFISLLPFIFISRIAFLYHYLSALVFGILILTVLYDKILKPRAEKVCSVYLGFLTAVFLVFLLLTPLTYGFLLSPKLNQIYNLFIKFLS